MYSTILCWLWPLIAGVLCGILGYLLGKSIASKWQSKYNGLKNDLDACEKRASDFKNQLNTASKWEGKYNSLKMDFDQSQQQILGFKSQSNDTSKWEEKYNGLKADFDQSQKQIAKLEQELKACEESKKAVVVPFNADAAKVVFGKKIQQDDLKIVEGIGPKVEELFHNHGIKTWKALSETSVEKCQEVLKTGGEHFKVHNPGTWPKQAELAYQGKWEELLKWQDELDGGK